MSQFMRAGALSLALILISLMFSLGCGGGSSGPVNVPADPNPPASNMWTSPVHHYTAEVFPHDYIVGKTYKFVLMQSVGDAVNAAENEFVVGLYDSHGALYPWRPDLKMVSVGDLFVNANREFMAQESGQKHLRVEVRDAQGHLYATIDFGPYFRTGLLWDSPVKRANIEAQPSQYIVGQFYDMELISNMGDLYNRQPDEVSIGLYRKDDEGAIFSDVLGLKFIPSGASLYINEVGRFSADSAGEKTVIAEVVDTKGHLYITVVLHPVFVSQGTPPPPDCRDLHPTKEAIGGFWWDCIGGVWVNTGVPVDNPPPTTYSLHIYGAQGEFTEGSTINIDEGNGYQLQVWELVGSDSSKVSLSGANATMESSILPFWCWEPTPREIMTVLWASPDYPDPEEPGNIFINPGVYDVKFTILHLGKQYCRSGYVKVIDRPDFP